MTTSWLTAAAGGVLIGLSATLLLWLNGRVAGVSGVLGGVLLPKAGDVAWRVAFLAGLVMAGGLYLTFVPGAPQPRTDFPKGALIAAGLLVGFGTRLGNGCTSGHGICGLARFSKRSLWAVLVFMGTALLTTYGVRHAIGGLS